MVWPDSSSVRTRNRVFSSQTRQGNAHFFLVGLGLGLDGLGNHGLGEHHLFQHDVIDGSQSVSPVVFASTPQGGDVVPARDFFNFLALVGVHLHDTTNHALSCL